MKKYLIIPFLFFLLIGNSSAQNYFDFVKNNTEKADVIVEGYVESKESYKANDGQILTKNHLTFNRIIKGYDLTNDSIKIITSGGKVGDIESICFHSAKLRLNEKGLFFLKYENGRFTLLGGNNGKITKKDINKKQQGIIQSLRYYVPDWDALITSVEKLVQGESITLDDLEPVKEELCFKIDDIKIKGDRLISAKVYAKSTTSILKFGGAEISIKYPTSSLGNYVVQNNLLDATAGDFVSNASVYNVSVLDSDVNEFSLKVESDCNSNSNFAELGPDYEEIAELLLEIDLTQIDEVIENAQITNGLGKYFDPNLSDCVDFKEICLGGDLLVAGCEITTIEIIGDAGAGIGSRARFIGEDFGDSPGKVQLPDADTDMEDGIELEELDENLISWSNDTIEINITATDDPEIMGSGKWRIDPSGFLNFSCSQEVNINYSVQKGNVIDTDSNGNSIAKSKHVRRYSIDTLQGAVSYYLDNTINSNTFLSSQGLTFDEVEILVQQALCEWEDKTGISLNYLGPIAPDEHYNLSDAKNVIFFTKADTVQAISMGTHAGAVTKLRIVTGVGCTEVFPATPNDYSIRNPYAIDSYIAINQENDWYDKNGSSSISSNEYDLFTIILHEIGHSLGLDHALDPSNNGFDDNRAMYPDVENNNDSKHSIDNGDSAGGTFIAEKSRELLQSPNLLTVVCVNDFTLNNVKFCMTTAVEEVLQTKDIFKIYPNVCLVETEVNIKNELEKTTGFKVFNSLGVLIFELNINGLDTKTLKFENKGIYFISAIVGNQLLTEKIIVQ